METMQRNWNGNIMKSRDRTSRFIPDSLEARALMQSLGMPYVIETIGEHPDETGCNTFWQTKWSCGCVTTNDHGKHSINLCDRGECCITYQTVKRVCESDGIKLEVKRK
jgi:hypothetical protein